MPMQNTRRPRLWLAYNYALRRASDGSALTQSELETLADRQAQRMLGLASRHDAFRRLDAGELQGTVAEVEFRGLRQLLDDGDVTCGQR